MKTVGSGLSNIRPTAPSALENTRGPAIRGGETDNSQFKDQLSALQNAIPTTAKAPTTASQGLKFSNHAIDRMQSRGIRFSPEQMAKIENAVSKAAAKGAKDTLLVTDESALIVSVKDNTVVTVMDKAQLKDNVFTKIDSTVVI